MPLILLGQLLGLGGGGGGPHDWATPYTSSDDLQDVNNWSPLYAAYNERAAIVGSPTRTAPAANSVLFGQSHPTYQGLALLQDSVGFMVQSWLNHTVTVEGAGSGSNPMRPWSMATIRAAAGLPTVVYYSLPAAGFGAPNGDSGPATAVTGRNNTAWRRQRYREIAWAGASWDVCGNAAAAGQRAFMVGSNPASFTVSANPIGGTKWSGTRWRCVAAGNWVRDESAQADLIDNLSAPPNALPEDTAYGNWDTGNPGVNEGNIQGRDVVSYWHLEELRLVLDLLRWRKYDASATATATARSGLASGQATLAAAQAAALAAYNAGSAGGGTAPAASASNSGSGSSWAASLQRGKLTSVYTLPSALKKWQVYLAADPTFGGTFNAEGDTVLNGQYHLQASGGPTASTSVSVVTGTDPTGNAPAFPAASPATEGWQPGEQAMVAKYNVAGGFAYCTVTD